MMMTLNRAADYATRVALHLALAPDDARVNRATLAKLAEASPTFVAKILQQLGDAKIVRSRPGSRGGFKLARPSADISILDVVTAVEGPLCLNRCLPPLEVCHRAGWCPAHPVWARAQHALEQVLGGTSLQQLADACRSPADGCHREGGDEGRVDVPLAALKH
jgi:Rrf2 family protein